jgi:uncharacterized protein YpbB
MLESNLEAFSKSATIHSETEIEEVIAGWRSMCSCVDVHNQQQHKLFGLLSYGFRRLGNL